MHNNDLPQLKTPSLPQVQAMKKCGRHPHTVTLIDIKLGAIYPKRDGNQEVCFLFLGDVCWVNLPPCES